MKVMPNRVKQTFIGLMSQQSSAHLWGLLLVTITGAVFRFRQATHPVSLSSDAASYLGIARRLTKTGNYATNFGYESALHWPPGTPYLFRAAFWLDPGNSLKIEPLLQAQFLISVLLIPAVYVLTRLVSGSLQALVAATITALYPPFIWGPNSLLSEPLGALLLTLTFIGFAASVHRHANRSQLIAGFAVSGALAGLTCLTRTDLLPPLVIGMLFMLATVTYRQGFKVGSIASFVCLAGVLAALLPWSIPASKRAGKPLVVTTGGSSALFVGTYLPGNGSTYDLKAALAPETRKRHPKFADTNYRQIPATTILQDVATRHPDLTFEAALNAETKANLGRFLKSDPVGFASMVQFKTVKMWSRYARGGDAAGVPIVTAIHVGLVLLTLAGLLLAVRRSTNPIFILALVIIVSATALHTLTVAHGRYNLPLMPILIATGVPALQTWLNSRLRKYPEA